MSADIVRYPLADAWCYKLSVNVRLFIFVKCKCTIGRSPTVIMSMIWHAPQSPNLLFTFQLWRPARHRRRAGTTNFSPGGGTGNVLPRLAGVSQPSRRSADRGMVIGRDQPNSRRKMRDFTGCFWKYAKFHGKFTEGVSEIRGTHRRYFEVLC